MLEFPASAVSTWGGAVVFANVLLTRLGIPIPAVPMLLFAGSSIAAGTLAFWPTLGAAVLGALIGDGVWFTAGRLYGRTLLAALGRLSPAIDAKVDVARALFERFGVPLVSISKFVPGLGLITPPLMGTTNVDARIYLLWDLVGVCAWASVWLLGGAAVERELHMLLGFVRSRGGTVVDVLVGAGVLFLLYRLIQRRRERRQFERESAAQRANRARRLSGPPTVLDARGDAASSGEARIPGALACDPASPEQLERALHVQDSVIYCVCADSASALDVTKRMRSLGYTRIRALRGGLDAWQRRGYPAEAPEAAAASTSDAPRTGPRRRAARGSARAAHRTNRAKGLITLRGFAPRSDARALGEQRSPRQREGG